MTCEAGALAAPRRDGVDGLQEGGDEMLSRAWPLWNRPDSNFCSRGLQGPSVQRSTVSGSGWPDWSPRCHRPEDTRRGSRPRPPRSNGNAPFQTRCLPLSSTLGGAFAAHVTASPSRLASGWGHTHQQTPGQSRDHAQRLSHHDLGTDRVPRSPRWLYR